MIAGWPHHTSIRHFTMIVTVSILILQPASKTRRT